MRQSLKQSKTNTQTSGTTKVTTITSYYKWATIFSHTSWGPTVTMYHLSIHKTVVTSESYRNCQISCHTYFTSDSNSKYNDIHLRYICSDCTSLNLWPQVHIPASHITQYHSVNTTVVAANSGAYAVSKWQLVDTVYMCVRWQQNLTEASRTQFSS